jgi:hypothetical protein
VLRVCPCGADISKRNVRAHLCLRCIHDRVVRRGKFRFAWIVSDPQRHERYKAYQREWDRSRVKPKTAVCVCGATFDLNPIGAPRRYCRPCARFYAKDLKNANTRRYYYERKSA